MMSPITRRSLLRAARRPERLLADRGGRCVTGVVRGHWAGGAAPTRWRALQAIRRLNPQWAHRRRAGRTCARRTGIADRGGRGGGAMLVVLTVVLPRC